MLYSSTPPPSGETKTVDGPFKPGDHVTVKSDSRPYKGKTGIIMEVKARTCIVDINGKKTGPLPFRVLVKSLTSVTTPAIADADVSTLLKAFFCTIPALISVSRARVRHGARGASSCASGRNHVLCAALETSRHF